MSRHPERSSVRAWRDFSPEAKADPLREATAHRRWSAAFSRRSRRGRFRSGDGRAERSSRSFERPPRGKRQCAVGLDAQQFDVHGELADAAVGVIQAELERVGIRAARQAGVKAGEPLLMPGFEARDGPGQFAAERIKGLATPQAEDGLRLARRMPATGWRSRRSDPAAGGGIPRPRSRSYALPLSRESLSPKNRRDA